MTMHPFNLDNIHPSWLPCIDAALLAMDPQYLQLLTHSNQWLPGPEKIFNAFSIPLNQVNYVLFGESPYPRLESANGYAFWDNAVDALWSETGLAKKVNRATSLRNIIKMLLIAEGMLEADHATQDNIAKLNKSQLINTNHDFFMNFIRHGFLLLNATPVLQLNDKPQKDARAWYPFMKELLPNLLTQRPDVQFILFGKIANLIDEIIPESHIQKLYAEHPYNISFITNKKVIDFFRPLHLLKEVNV